MKNHIVTLIVFSLLSLTSCQDEETPDLKTQLTTGSWTLYQEKNPGSTMYNDVWSFSRSIFSFSNSGHYVAKYPYNPADTIYIEGEWALDPSSLIIDFYSKDTVYHFLVANDPPPSMATRQTPIDWKILSTTATELEVDLIKGDSLYEYSWILKK